MEALILQTKYKCILLIQNTCGATVINQLKSDEILF